VAPSHSDGARPSAAAADGNASTLLRLGWMLAGNAALAVLATMILAGPAWTMTAKDLLYWLVVAAVIALRYVDVFRHHGQTADGAPATPRHFRRYVIGLLVVAAFVWTCCHSFQLLGHAEDGS